MTKNKHIIALTIALSIIAISISLYSGVNTVACYGCGGEETFNEKVEAGIEAYIAKKEAEMKQANTPGAADPIEVNLDDDPMKGNKNAPVTIVEFSEYQCPYCKRYVDQTLVQIQENYIDTGKVKYVFRDYPLGFHEHAKTAAMAAECVKEKGGDEAYWGYHDVLFENQSSLSTENIKKYALDMGYDVSNCLDSEKYADEIDADMEEGLAYGVQGTPAFFINGRFVSGAQPYEIFEGIIEEELNK